MARKKKRTAKQIAATKRMIAARKAQLRKKKTKKKVAKKKTRRKVAKRRTNPKKRSVSKKSHLWFVFKCKANSVLFWTATKSTHPWSKDKSRGVLFKLKKDAEKAARGIAGSRRYAGWQVGVASDDTTTAQIRAGCSK